MTLDCIEMGRSLGAWESGDLETVRAIHAQSAERLARAGADFFICPDNTSHIALEAAGPPLALPGLNIADIIAEEAARRGMRRVGVLGTRFTMNGPVHRRALAARGIGFEIPPAEARREIDRIIFDELVEGVLKEGSRARYIRIIAELEERGCDGVALACTEIPLLVTAQNSPLPVLDSTRLLARAAFEVAAGERPAPTWRGGPPGAERKA